jgi:signal transduction histidine kinase
MVRTLVNWFRHGDGSGGPSLTRLEASSPEAITLRGITLLVLAAFVAKTLTATPHPGMTGRSAALLGLLVAFVALVVAIVAVFAASAAQSRVEGAQIWMIALLLALTGVSAALSALQPEGSWQLGPALVACFAAIGLGRTAGVVTFGVAAVVLLVAGAFEGRGGTLVSVLIFTALPWFVVFRLLREVRRRRDALEVSQVAEARAAATAERGRLVREMHDVLAHSLSALALQLESARLLARDRGVDRQVARALDEAHELAASGLQEARRAIATERGAEVPGPERIGVLVDSFREQSGIPIAVEIRGEPHELPPDARLAVYRTAQEALTNVRRHATPDRVEVKLDYLPGRTTLVVEDHAAADAPPPAGLALGSGGGYGLTGMRERAELLGGRLLAAPTADGFRVELWLPVAAPVMSGAHR